MVVVLIDIGKFTISHCINGNINLTDLILKRTINITSTASQYSLALFSDSKLYILTYNQKPDPDALRIILDSFFDSYSSLNGSSITLEAAITLFGRDFDLYLLVHQWSTITNQSPFKFKGMMNKLMVNLKISSLFDSAPFLPLVESPDAFLDFTSKLHTTFKRYNILCKVGHLLKCRLREGFQIVYQTEKRIVLWLYYNLDIVIEYVMVPHDRTLVILSLIHPKEESDVFSGNIRDFLTYVIEMDELLKLIHLPINRKLQAFDSAYRFDLDSIYNVLKKAPLSLASPSMFKSESQFAFYTFWKNMLKFSRFWDRIYESRILYVLYDDYQSFLQSLSYFASFALSENCFVKHTEIDVESPIKALSNPLDYCIVQVERFGERIAKVMILNNLEIELPCQEILEFQPSFDQIYYKYHWQYQISVGYERLASMRLREGFQLLDRSENHVLLLKLIKFPIIYRLDYAASLRITLYLDPRILDNGRIIEQISSVDRFTLSQSFTMDCLLNQKNDKNQLFDIETLCLPENLIDKIAVPNFIEAKQLVETLLKLGGYNARREETVFIYLHHLHLILCCDLDSIVIYQIAKCNFPVLDLFNRFYSFVMMKSFCSDPARYCEGNKIKPEISESFEQSMKKMIHSVIEVDMTNHIKALYLKPLEMNVFESSKASFDELLSEYFERFTLGNQDLYMLKSKDYLLLLTLSLVCLKNTRYEEIVLSELPPTENDFKDCGAEDRFFFHLNFYSLPELQSFNFSEQGSRRKGSFSSYLDFYQVQRPAAVKESIFQLECKVDLLAKRVLLHQFLYLPLNKNMLFVVQKLLRESEEFITIPLKFLRTLKCSEKFKSTLGTLNMPNIGKVKAMDSFYVVETKLPTWFFMLMESPKNITAYIWPKNAALEYEITEHIQLLVTNVNRMILLKEMVEKRYCSRYLITPDLGKNSSDDEEEEKPTKKHKFMLGQFECPLLDTVVFHLNWRIKPLQALKTITVAFGVFAISNRINLFVYEDSFGSVFYLRLNEEEDADKKLSLILKIYGMSNASPAELKSNLTPMIEAKLEQLTQTVLSALLSRNPQIKDEDYEALMKYNITNYRNEDDLLKMQFFISELKLEFETNLLDILKENVIVGTSLDFVPETLELLNAYSLKVPSVRRNRLFFLYHSTGMSKARNSGFGQGVILIVLSIEDQVCVESFSMINNTSVNLKSLFQIISQIWSYSLQDYVLEKKIRAKDSKNLIEHIDVQNPKSHLLTLKNRVVSFRTFEFEGFTKIDDTVHMNDNSLIAIQIDHSEDVETYSFYFYNVTAALYTEIEEKYREINGRVERTADFMMKPFTNLSTLNLKDVKAFFQSMIPLESYPLPNRFMDYVQLNEAESYFDTEELSSVYTNEAFEVDRQDIATSFTKGYERFVSLLLDHLKESCLRFVVDDILNSSLQVFPDSLRFVFQYIFIAAEKASYPVLFMMNDESEECDDDISRFQNDFVKRLESLGHKTFYLSIDHFLFRADDTPFLVSFKESLFVYSITEDHYLIVEKFNLDIPDSISQEMPDLRPFLFDFHILLLVRSTIPGSVVQYVQLLQQEYSESSFKFYISFDEIADRSVFMQIFSYPERFGLKVYNSGCLQYISDYFMFIERDVEEVSNYMASILVIYSDKEMPNIVNEKLSAIANHALIYQSKEKTWYSFLEDMKEQAQCFLDKIDLYKKTAVDQLTGEFDILKELDSLPLETLKLPKSIIHKGHFFAALSMEHILYVNREFAILSLHDTDMSEVYPALNDFAIELCKSLFESVCLN